MTARIFFYGIVFLFLSLKAQAAPFVLVNMGPDFKNYVLNYRYAERAVQWRGWKDFEKKYQIYFDQVLCDPVETGCESDKRHGLENFFRQLPTFENSMWKIFDAAESTSDFQVKKFTADFPDVKSDVPIVFMPSLLRFNGLGGFKLNDRYSLIIGADMAALRENNMDVLFSHEFFHTYHFEKMSALPIYQTMASPLWFEGLATWVSQNLNPGASPADILMNPDLADYCKEAGNFASMAKFYLDFIRTSYADEKSDVRKKDWFSANGSVLPHRRGYCLGLKVVTELQKTQSLDQLLKLNEAQFTGQIESVLNNVAAVTALAAPRSPPLACGRISEINCLRPEF